MRFAEADARFQATPSFANHPLNDILNFLATLGNDDPQQGENSMADNTTTTTTNNPTPAPKPTTTTTTHTPAQPATPSTTTTVQK